MTRVASFLRKKWHSHIEFNVGRFLANYQLPPSHPKGIHPSLVDAMCLMACCYSGSHGLQKYERLFYGRLSVSLVDSLAHVDRLHDFIRASLILGIYCRCRGRYVPTCVYRPSQLTQFTLSF